MSIYKRNKRWMFHSTQYKLKERKHGFDEDVKHQEEIEIRHGEI